MRRARVDPRTATTAAAGAAAAGTGTLTVLLAEALGTSHAGLSRWLMLVVPSVTVLLSIFWNRVQVRFDNYLRDREVRALIGAASARVTAALENPLTSAEQKQKLQKQLEQLQSIELERFIARINSIDIVDLPGARRGKTA